MMSFKLIEGIVGTAIGGLIVVLFTGNLPTTSNLENIPLLDIVGNFAIIIVIIILGVFGLVYGLRHKKYGGYFTSDSKTYENYITIATIDHSDVKWEIGIPFPGCSNKSQLRIKFPPRCPECKTELGQEKSKVGGYIWKCVRCNFKKRNKKSYWNERDGVEKIARRLWEEGKIK